MQKFLSKCLQDSRKSYTFAVGIFKKSDNEHV